VFKFEVLVGFPSTPVYRSTTEELCGFLGSP